MSAVSNEITQQKATPSTKSMQSHASEMTKRIPNRKKNQSAKTEFTKGAKHARTPMSSQEQTSTKRTLGKKHADREQE
jgi:hypothetical protein